MVINDVLEQMLVYSDKTDNYDIKDLKSSMDDRLLLMIKCINITLNNIATEYIAFRKTEVITAVNNCIGYEKFAERLLNVYNVKKNGYNVLWKMQPEFIRVDVDGELQVDYCYLPSELQIDDMIIAPQAVTTDILALGALANYCFITERREDGRIYEEKFRLSMKSAVRVKREMRVKRRRWQ